jgi:hypothetical protein
LLERFDAARKENPRHLLASVSQDVISFVAAILLWPLTEPLPLEHHVLRWGRLDDCRCDDWAAAWT